jgi:hypothetical protein
MVELDDGEEVCPIEWIVRHFRGFAVRDIVPGEEPLLIFENGKAIITSINGICQNKILENGSEDWDRLLAEITGLCITCIDYVPSMRNLPDCVRVRMDNPRKQRGVISLLTLENCTEMIEAEYWDRIVPD